MILKQLCVYAETEKICKYTVGGGVHKYTLRKGEKELCDGCVCVICMCVAFPLALSAENPRSKVTPVAMSTFSLHDLWF